MNLELADQLIKFRKEHGLSQEELASRLGISRQAVSKWERAEASPDTDNLIMLARIYGISLDELIHTGKSETVAERQRGGKAVSAFASFPYPVVLTIIYLGMGFIFNLWHPGWMLYLTIPVYYWGIGELRKRKKAEAGEGERKPDSTGN